MAQLKYWNGTAWVSASIGAQGIQGVQGNLGLQGTQGTQGPQGTTGLQGFTGLQGTQGLTGIQGTQGTTGNNGAQGTTGSQGTTGTQGATGTQGLTGTQGTQGTQGPQGTQGVQGTTGLQGFTGLQGTTGSGTQGTQGIQGGFSFGLGTGVQTFLSTPSSANLAAALTDETGTGANVFATTPTISTPLLTLSTTSSTTEGRIAWDSTNDKILVGGTLNGTAQAIEFASSTLTISTPTFTTNAYTVVLTDKDKWLELSNGATAGTLNIPTDASVAFPIGTQINIIQTNTGQITIAAVTPGTTTVNGTPGLKLREQWSSATIIKRAANSWVAVGDLSA
jgi:hypothetical protein